MIRVSDALRELLSHTPRTCNLDERKIVLAVAAAIQILTRRAIQHAF